jgi:hypothetical protein
VGVVVASVDGVVGVGVDGVVVVVVVVEVWGSDDSE